MAFIGSEHYEELGLTYIRARFYEPSSGRFITKDPVRDGFNWYSYCGGNPVIYVDLAGLAYYLTIYVDKPDSIGDSGHVFIGIKHIKDKTNKLVEEIKMGLYPIPPVKDYEYLTSVKGRILKEFDSLWDIGWQYEIGKYEYNAAKDKMNADFMKTNEGEYLVYKLLTYNCVDWALSVAKEAKVPIWNYERLSIDTPRQLSRSFKMWAFLGIVQGEIIYNIKQ